MIFKLDAKVQTIGQTSFALEQKRTERNEELTSQRYNLQNGKSSVLKYFFELF